MDSREQISQDIPEALQSFKQIIEDANSVDSSIQSLFDKLKSGVLSTDQGISFMDLKCHMLVSYLTNLVYVLLRKVTGNRLEGDLSIERLVEIRTVLEKVRPLEQKLKHQIDKLIKIAHTGQIDANDPLGFKANPNALSSRVTDDEKDESGSESDTETTEPKTKVYVPPKLSAVYYEADETQQDKKQKLLERNRKRALSTSIMNELRREYDDAPDVIRETMGKITSKKELRERIQYEEDNMKRLPFTKKEKHQRKTFDFGDLRGISRFEDISALEGNVDDLPMKKRKKKVTKLKGKNKKKFFKKRH